jgi:formylmethanofuran dehydrogenase subunit C
MTVVLTLREAPVGPVDASVLRPDRLAGLSRAEVERLELRHGNRPVAVGELFEVSGDGEEDVRIEGDLRLVARLGAGMSGGRMVVTGAGARAGAPASGGGPVSGGTGPHAGAGMSGGELVVEGDVGDYAGAELQGGRVVIHGSAGRRLGGVYGGARAGMRGGEILVHGDAGEEVGAGLRRGLIAVGGRVGSGAGLRALAGTIVALGGVGPRPGMAMRRASIVASAPVTPLPTYALACTYRPPFLAVVLRHLRALGLRVGEEWLAGPYARWSGDRLDVGRGEILVLEP